VIVDAEATVAAVISDIKTKNDKYFIKFPPEPKHWN
jgi:hypothetical protein